MQIRLATRGSRLALAQSGLIADALGALGAEVELVQVRTLGDVSTAPLSSLGGVGVFVAAVRDAVLSGACDLAVHSLKDLPTTPADGLVLAAVPPREDPRDALCARDGLTLASLPTGATVGTGSPRRAAQLAITRPDLRIVDIRGNVDTRLGRVGADLDAVVLAVAGLNRLGLSEAITQVIDPSDMLPAPAQGALAIECRSDADPLRALLAELDDPASRLAVETERTIMRLVEAGCSAPFGALAQVADEGLAVNARLVTGAGARSAMAVGPLVAAPALAARVAHEVAPLRGLRVLMPSSGLADVLSAEGAVVTTAAFTHTEPLDIGGFVEALGRRPDVLAFTSARTLRVIEGAGLDLAQLIGPEVVIAAVGHATAAAIEAAGLTVTVRPAAALAAAFPEGPGTVLVPGAADPAPELSAHLRARRWQVTTVPVYRTIDASAIDASIAEAWPDQDVFVVTAPSIARAATKLLGVPGPPVVAIGSTSAAAARELGLEVAATAAEATPVGLVEALISLRKDST